MGSAEPLEKRPLDQQVARILGGGGEIRTHEGRKPLTVFKTVAFNRSATPPQGRAVYHRARSVRRRLLEQRDAAVLVREKGYVLKGAGIANMFPQTSHVESIALFEQPAAN